MRRGKFGLAWGILALLLSAGVVLAAPLGQGAPRIDYNSTVQGTITDTQPVVYYTFEGRAGDVVLIEMTTLSGDLDPFLELFGPDQTLLIANDDIDSSDRNARIGPYTLPVDGLHQIGATRYNLAQGITTGTYALTLTLVGGEGATASESPPDLGVPYQRITVNETVSGQLGEAGVAYYLFHGDAGDVVLGTMRPQDPQVIPVVRFLDAALAEVSVSDPPAEDGSATAYYVLRMPGWYLIEVASQGGGGGYTLETLGFSTQLIGYGDVVSGQVTADDPNDWYVFQARYGDTVSAEMTATGGDLVPYVVLADVNLNDLAYSDVGANPTGLTYAIPQSDSYVLLVSREGLSEGSTTGSYSLALSGRPLDPATLNPTPLGYGRSAQGMISDSAPVAYYSFQGKRGDVVTLTMEAADPASLDPYLVLTDAAFTELINNDDVGTANTARIFQYQLPEDGIYYVLATRPGLERGQGTGSFTLELVAGEVQLTAGAVEATVRWNHTADVDLFVQDPNGDVVGWSSPESPSGGVLEVDTNANCETLTALPVEHIYWPAGTNLPGQYLVAVWYQLDCENRGPVLFDLSVSVGGQEVARASEQLERGQRYELTITVNPDGSAHSNNDGTITTPDTGAGGNPVIAYGDTVTGSLNNEQYILFYDFEGQAGDAIVVTAERTSGDLDTYLGLFDPQGELLAQDDDSGGDRNARLEFTLPATGTYSIAVTRYQVEEGLTGGDFRMTLSRAN